MQAALGYYWALADPRRVGTPEWEEEQEAAWGAPIPQPTLYLHGTQDGCQRVSAGQVERATDYLGEGSESELVEGVGHFMLVEKPEEINQRILNFLGKA